MGRGGTKAADRQKWHFMRRGLGGFFRAPRGGEGLNLILRASVVSSELPRRRRRHTEPKGANTGVK